MTFERTDVDSPLWRKKVDGSIFEHSGTAIPSWVREIWHIDDDYSDVVSKTDPKAAVAIEFDKVDYRGWVTASKRRGRPLYRLWFDKSLLLPRLMSEFPMSHMRELEFRLRRASSTKPLRRADLETEIPFWEFLDIEYSRADRRFKFVAHYKQEAVFPALFRKFIESTTLERIDNEVRGKEGPRIVKSQWRARADLMTDRGEKNVIYTLIDTENRQIYIGEAIDLYERLSVRRPEIPEWNHYRYSRLPAELFDYRVHLERMVIRDFAAVLPNPRAIPHEEISDYTLVNRKIDR